MRFDQLQLGHISVVEVKPDYEDDFDHRLSAGTEVRIIRLEATDETLLQADVHTWAVVGADARNQDALDDLFLRPPWRLCWLAGAFPRQGMPSRLVVQVHAFEYFVKVPEPLNLGVTERIIEQVRCDYLNLDASPDDVARWLAEQTLLDGPPLPRALATSGAAPTRRELASFRLHGHEFAADLSRQDDGSLHVIRLTRASPPDLPVSLLEAELVYVDATVAGQFGRAGQTLLDNLVRQSNSYLALWQEYNQLERNGILGRARDFGWLRYSQRELLPDGTWRFRVQRDQQSRLTLARLQDRTEMDLEAAEKLPDELLDQPDSQDDENLAWQVDRQTPRPLAGQCVGVSPQRGTLDLRPIDPESEEQPPAKGVLHISLTGDRVRLNRRSAARDLIARGRGPMPQLGLFLEGRPVPTAGHRRFHPKKAKVADLFGGDPTLRQLEALDVALNTPDIALIQGPPGTGKTRVIAALERIIANDRGARVVAGQTLLTSYQHDAVEHAASRTLVLGLPAVKIGHRRDHDRAISPVEKWRQERLAQLKEELDSYSQPPAAYLLAQARELAIGYQITPMTAAETAAMLQGVCQRTLGWVPAEVISELETLWRRLTDQISQWRQSPELRELMARAVSGLRTEPVPFADDGPRSAARLLHRLGEDQFSGEELDLLQRARGWLEGDELDFLPTLARLKERLLDKFIEDPALDRAQLPNLDVQTALTVVVEALHQQVVTCRHPVERVLHDYLDDLEYDPGGIRQTLEAYTAVLAATCQQSVSRSMVKIKGGDAHFGFDSVIVDEAARANPLDLLVPMARAKRRIILVGDHRQLPHILEPDVERQLEVSTEETRDILSKSLFERLFNHARRLELEGDPKRAVTLNAQYRMHPVLGAFVSQVFYEPYGERFDSPRGVEEFQHHIEGYEGKVAAWKEIPYAAGSEKKGRSKRRPVEAQWVARETARILRQDASLSVGVISFYAAQVAEIMRAMQKLDLVEHSEETQSGLAVSRKYREVRDRSGALVERLRVATVDAFQGKEFDVVLLSMTRSNTIKADDLRSLRQKYGFLTLENRLCVAMSRQKKLLIVAGDPEMLRATGAKEAVPGLKAFYDLCGGDHGIRL